jgi:phage FluMu protein gp41
MKTATVELPSGGLFYEWMEGGDVDIRGMTAEEEKELVSNRPPIEKIVTLASNCVVKPKLNPRELLLNDLMFLLFSIRGIFLDNKYAFPARCNACANVWRVSVTIPDDLEVVKATENSSLTIEVPLADAGDTVTARQLLVKDFIEAERRARRITKGNDPDALAHILRASAQIAAVNGQEQGPEEAKIYYERLSLRDTHAIRDAVEEHEFGIRQSVWVDCPSCGYTDEFRIKISPEFFRPRANRR